MATVETLAAILSYDQTMPLRVMSPDRVASRHVSQPSFMPWNGSWVKTTYTRFL